MAIVGGIGTLFGAFIGAFAIVGLENFVSIYTGALADGDGLHVHPHHDLRARGRNRSAAHADRPRPAPMSKNLYQPAQAGER